MHFLYLTCEPEQTDQVLAELWEAGTTGVHESDGVAGQVKLQAGFESGADRPVLLQHFHKYAPEWREEPETDWIAQTKAVWPGRAVGTRLFIAAPWVDAEAAPERLRLTINPGMASGTGEHPCTQLALEAIEANLRPGQKVADIGTGSGILAIAAALLGASYALGIDPDAEALEVAREQLALNTGAAVDWAVASADAVANHSFDLVVANINASVLLAIADDLLRLPAPGGTLILTGFQRDEAATVSAVFHPHGRSELSGWVCLTSRVSPDA